MFPSQACDLSQIIFGRFTDAARVPVEVSNNRNVIRVESLGLELFPEGENARAKRFASVGEAAFRDPGINQVVDLIRGSNVLRHTETLHRSH